MPRVHGQDRLRLRELRRRRQVSRDGERPADRRDGERDGAADRSRSATSTASPSWPAIWRAATTSSNAWCATGRTTRTARRRGRRTRARTRRSRTRRPSPTSRSRAWSWGSSTPPTSSGAPGISEDDKPCANSTAELMLKGAGAGLALSPLAALLEGKRAQGAPGRVKRVLLFCSMGTQQEIWSPTAVSGETSRRSAPPRSRWRRFATTSCSSRGCPAAPPAKVTAARSRCAGSASSTRTWRRRSTSSSRTGCAPWG